MKWLKCCLFSQAQVVVVILFLLYFKYPIFIFQYLFMKNNSTEGDWWVVFHIFFNTTTTILPCMADCHSYCLGECLCARVRVCAHAHVCPDNGAQRSFQLSWPQSTELISRREREGVPIYTGMPIYLHYAHTGTHTHTRNDVGVRSVVVRRPLAGRRAASVLRPLVFAAGDVSS